MNQELKRLGQQLVQAVESNNLTNVVRAYEKIKIYMSQTKDPQLITQYQNMMNKALLETFKNENETAQTYLLSQPGLEPFKRHGADVSLFERCLTENVKNAYYTLNCHFPEQMSEHINHYYTHVRISGLSNAIKAALKLLDFGVPIGQFQKSPTHLFYELIELKAEEASSEMIELVMKMFLSSATDISCIPKNHFKNIFEMALKTNNIMALKKIMNNPTMLLQGSLLEDYKPLSANKEKKLLNIRQILYQRLRMTHLTLREYKKELRSDYSLFFTRFGYRLKKRLTKLEEPISSFSFKELWAIFEQTTALVNERHQIESKKKLTETTATPKQLLINLLSATFLSEQLFDSILVDRIINDIAHLHRKEQNITADQLYNRVIKPCINSELAEFKEEWLAKAHEVKNIIKNNPDFKKSFFTTPGYICWALETILEHELRGEFSGAYYLIDHIFKHLEQYSKERNPAYQNEMHVLSEILTTQITQKRMPSAEIEPASPEPATPEPSCPTASVLGLDNEGYPLEDDERVEEKKSDPIATQIEEPIELQAHNLPQCYGTINYLGSMVTSAEKSATELEARLNQFNVPAAPLPVVTTLRNLQNKEAQASEKVPTLG